MGFCGWADVFQSPAQQQALNVSCNSMNYYSNIYWHFTGSPRGIDWSKIFCPKDILAHGDTKSDEDSFSIARKILTTRNLLATCKETITRSISSEPFCCVTDIPVQNLKEHTAYYGKVSIGFEPYKIQKEFNPVFYVSKDKLKSRFDSMSEEDRFRHSMAGSILLGKGGKSTPHSSILDYWINSQIDEKELGSYIFNYFKITSFSVKNEETFYREREWRKTGTFSFEPTDVAAIIVPNGYFKDTKNLLSQLNYIDTKVLTWEFLGEI